MKKNRIFLPVLTALALITGLLLPFLAAAGQDYAIEHISWPLTEDNAHYAYQGTLMNRVVALNAYLNSSPAVAHHAEESAASLPSPIAGLSSFLPADGAELARSSAFSLSPKQYAAQYRYLAMDYVLEDGSLSVIIDEETLLSLRMELMLPPEEMNQWLADRSLWDVLRGYAAFLNLGEPTDDETSISTVIRSQSAQLRGTAYKITVTVIPSAGSLLLKLTASTPA